MMSSSQRRAGILLHPTSLPSSTGIGEIGPQARLFADWLFESQVQVWQILPLVPTGSGHSPYSSGSAFAANPLLISLDDLQSEGWVNAEDIKECEGHSPDRVDYDLINQKKTSVLQQAAQRWKQDPSQFKSQEWLTFIDQQAHWIEDTALFYHLTHVLILSLGDNIPRGMLLYRSLGIGTIE